LFSVQQQQQQQVLETPTPLYMAVQKRLNSPLPGAATTNQRLFSTQQTNQHFNSTQKDQAPARLPKRRC
jgi:hypothetical protein